METTSCGPTGPGRGPAMPFMPSALAALYQVVGVSFSPYLLPWEKPGGLNRGCAGGEQHFCPFSEGGPTGSAYIKAGVVEASCNCTGGMVITPSE